MDRPFFIFAKNAANAIGLIKDLEEKYGKENITNLHIHIDDKRDRRKLDTYLRIQKYNNIYN